MSNNSGQANHLDLLKQAYLALDEMQARVEELEQARTEPIAIIGMGCRFPGGADDPDTFWQILRDGVDAIAPVPSSRWDADALYDPDPNTPGKAYTRQGGFLPAVDQFDPQFFGISPRETLRMDPQQRLLLEVTWEALERAGLAADQLAGSQTGVFVGISGNDYLQLYTQQSDLAHVDAYLGTGNAFSVAAGRLSYTLGLQGPSVAVDTACSSSLVAVHLACQSLRSSECRMALAAGVNLLLSPGPTVIFSKARMLAADGRCKTFDAAADGYGRGEGCGVVVLKRLSDAMADRDTILALIRGSAINQDGRSGGLTVPNGPAQEAVIRQALAAGDVSPAEVNYIEAHGTGTPLGDPIEVRALANVLGEGRPVGKRFALGSVKTNIGHLEAGAGIAGLIKTVLAMQHGEIPPHLHLHTPNPYIDWDTVPITVPTERTPWLAGSGRRVAGVSSFGFSGTNAHVVLEEAPVQPREPAPTDRSAHVLALSAKTASGLQQLAGRMERFLATHPAVSLADVCYTANTGRSQFAHRLALVGDSPESIRDQLADYVAGTPPATLLTGQFQTSGQPEVAWLFTGQGSQYAGMGRQLYDSQPAFREAIDRCNELLRPHMKHQLLDLLYPATEAATPLDETAYTQPALFALEYALAEMWRSWGIEPDIVMGHSVGEYVAACVAGAFSLEDGLALIAERGRLMQELPQAGVMAVVFADRSTVEAALAPYQAEVAIAAINGPENTVVSGASTAVAELLALLKTRGVASRMLVASQAFHSPLIEPMLDAFEATVARVAIQPLHIPLVSNLSGEILQSGSTLPAAYWREHARQPVHFEKGVEALAASNCHIFMELGPGSTLLGLAKRCSLDADAVWLPSLKKGADDWRTTLHSLQTLWIRGVKVDWVRFDLPYGRRRVALPTYPFERARYWLEEGDGFVVDRMQLPAIGAVLHPLLGQRVRSALPSALWETQLSTTILPYLDDHRVQGMPVLPATAYLGMVAAAMAAQGFDVVDLRDVTFHEALFLPPGNRRTTQIVLTPQDGDSKTFQILGLPLNNEQADSSWTLHASGRIAGQADRGGEAPAAETLEAIRARCLEPLSADQHYRQLHERGLEYGPSFQAVSQVIRRDGEALGRMQLPPALEPDVDRYPIHPALLDACLQLLADTLPDEQRRATGHDTYLPVGLDQLRIYRPAQTRLWSHAVLRTAIDGSVNSFAGDVRLLADDGEVVAEAIGMRLQRLGSGDRRRFEERLHDWTYKIEWQPCPPVQPIEQPVSESWLVLADRAGLGDALRHVLQAHGIACLTVGTADSAQDTHDFTVDPANPAAYDQVLDAVRQLQLPPLRRIVHLWGMDTVPLDSTTIESLLQAEQFGCGSLLHLVQALTRLQWTDPPRIWSVTHRAQAVKENDGPLAVAQAPLWGFGRALALEQPEIWGGLIDLENRTPDEAEALWQTIRADADENQLAFREGQQFAPRLVRAAVAAPPSQTFAPRPDGTYCVTGGLGGLGLQVARWLVEHGARRLVLIGRRDLPARSTWDRLPPDSPYAHQIEVVRGLERQGATVRVAAADVGDADQLAALFEDLDRTFPPVRGIIHAAGSLTQHAICDMDIQTLSAVLRPKVSGAWALHQVTREMPLDFFVMFSSIAAVWGSRELAHYAAGNHFLQALAHARYTEGLPAIAINWGPWASSGMAASSERARALQLSGLRAIPSEQALAALACLATQPATDVTVVDVDWTVFKSLYNSRTASTFFEQIEAREPAAAERAPTLNGERQRILALPAIEQQSALIRYLQNQVADVLRSEPARVDVNQPLTAVGLDSLMAVELKNRVEGSLSVTLPMVRFLQGPTIDQLAAAVLEELERTDNAVAEAPAAVAIETNDAEHRLSLGQRALWFIHQLAPENTAYNIVGAGRIRSEIDPLVLQKAFAQLIARHPSLRTTFAAPTGIPTQIIHPTVEATFQVEDGTEWSEDHLHRRLVEEAHRPFDLQAGPLFRVQFFSRGPRDHVLLLTAHHTIADFWSLVIVIYELGIVYPALLAGHTAELPSVQLSYTDYARWQDRMLQGPEGERLWNYWRGQLAGELPILDLPTDYPRPSVQTYRGASQTLTLDAELTRQIKALCETHQATLYMALLGAYQALLHRYTGQDDVLVGSPMAGRNRPEFAGIVGYLVSPVVLRAHFSDDVSFADLLQQTRQTVLGALEHQDYPLALLAERLRPARDPSRSPLFQVMFSLQKAQLLNDQGLTPFVLRENGARMNLGGLELESLALEQRVAQFDLTLVMVEAEGGLAASLEYNTDLFAPATIARMLDHFRTLIRGMVAEPQRSIATLPLVAGDERQQLLVQLNATRRSYPTTLRVHDLVTAQAARTPARVAVVAGERQISYEELDRRANQLARYLQQLGAGPDVPVAICTDRSVDMVVGLLGILKAGAAYVPLEPTYPRERLAYVLGDCGAGVLLTEERLADDLPEHRALVVRIDADWQSVARESDQPVDSPATPDNLAYIIYTSGSLGWPKGVQLSHRAVVNFLHSMCEQPGLSEQDTLLAVTTLSFDIAVLELFLPLVTGARLTIAARETSADGARLIEQIETSGATVMQATPATWQMLLNAGWSGNARLRALCGGEALPQVLANALRARTAQLWNMYGPTETTIWSAATHVGTGEVTIGGPIANTQIYLLDAQMEPVPIGVPGELYIGGIGLARGYLRRPALTAGQFLPDPFVDQPGARMYRTGDLARRQSSGEIVVLGRIDHQVKVRGFRIELGEIEAVLRRHPAIREAVVVAREVSPGDKRLVAYGVTGDSVPPVASDLRNFLQQTLPGYMVPSAYVMLDALPLTPNGKVDRRALPAPEALHTELETPYIEPQTELERRIAEIWQTVLQVERVGIHSNFFDLGGHSLLAAQVHSRLRNELGRDLSIVELFKYPTVHALARHLGDERREQPAFEALHRRVARFGEAAGRAAGAPMDIAIVGMAGRFPGAPDISTFWKNLRDGVTAVTIFSDGELKAAGVEPDLLNHPLYVKAGPVLDNVDCFDAHFFGFNPREAALLDPQHRLFLQCAWQALENAGYNSETYPGQIGVYAGVGMNTYLLNNLVFHRDQSNAVSDFQTMIANDKDYLTTRVSYLLNLHGPSVTVQSACSTSLVAVTLACQSLLSGQSDIALAGGSSIRVPQTAGYLYQAEGIRSNDGYCRAFDAQASGTVFGSGVGVVVLKRLNDALRDGDHIEAVIKGAAINNDGSGKIGFTAPSITGQAAVIAEALAVAGVDAKTIAYVETHGTGTQLGDPIEVAALTEAFRASTDARSFCGIGSVKSNVGHLDTAAGVAGLIKTVLALKHGAIPPTLHCAEPNPQVDWEESPFYVNTTLTEWAAGSAPRRAGVSALGIGGTNAHVIVEEAPPLKPADNSRPWQLLLLSAKTEAALETATTNLVAHFHQHPELDLADVAYTLHVGRRLFNYRRTLVCQNIADATAALETRAPRRVVTHMQEQAGRAVAFMFPGGGAQYVNMCAELYQHEPVFRAEIDQCAAILAPHIGLDLRKVLYPSDAPSAEDAQRLEAAALALPALFATEYALAQLWMAWGIMPRAMIGHSLGEYVAACLAGVISLEDALALVALRGRLFEQLPPGAMLSVPLPDDQLRSLMPADVSVAAINAPGLSVVSGPVDAIEKLAGTLATQNVDASRLHIAVAAHSAMVEPILDEFEQFVTSVVLHPPQKPYISNVTGTWITAAEATDPRYWVRHLRETVRFGAGLRELLRDPQQILLEVGPGHTLNTFARQSGIPLAGRVVLSSVRPAREQQPDQAFILNTLGQLTLAGAPVDWSTFYAHERRLRLPLPTYPFEEQRFWIDPPARDGKPAAQRPSQERRPDPADWGYLPVWKQSRSPVQPLAAPVDEGPWLLFADEAGVCAVLVDQLVSIGRHAISVRPGQTFARLNAHEYTLDPRQPAHYEQLVSELGALPIRPQKVVHAWNVTTEAPDTVDAWGDDYQALGFYSLLFLTQAVARAGDVTPVELNVLSNHACTVIGNDGGHPAKATLAGPVKVLPQEYPFITARHIDLVPQVGQAQQARLVEHLLADLTAPVSDTLIVYRGLQRWVQTFEPARLEQTNPVAAQLRERGVYLITGGLGAIGLTLADSLARTVQARLVLTSRSMFPARESWADWLAKDDGEDETARKIRQLQRLEQAGAEVLVVRADAADYEAMERALAQAYARWGTIHGVIHAAGIPTGGLSLLKTAEETARVLAPKVRGTLVLTNLLRDVSLDFLLLCSSISSIIGAVGQIDHCAGNAFLDAFAHHHMARTGVFTVAVNWPAWQEIGQAAQTAVPQELRAWREMTLQQGIAPDEGVELFGRILEARLPQVILAPHDLAWLIEQNKTFTTSHYLDELGRRQAGQAAYPRPLLATAYEAPRDEIETRIAAIWEHMLGIEQVGRHDNFFELGGHSLLATQIMSRVRETFQVELSLRRLLEAPTVAEMALAIVQQRATQTDDATLLHMLAELEQLSDDDTRAMLASEHDYTNGQNQ